MWGRYGVLGAGRRLTGVVWLGLAISGCSGKVKSKVVVTPPKPAPSVAEAPQAPAATPRPRVEEDGDDDGITGSADRCPEEAETKNGFEDGDGCPDEVPLAYLDGDTMVLKKQVNFAPGGRLATSSNDVLDAMAEALSKAPEAGEVEIGVFYAGGTEGPADGTATRTRAGEIRTALTKRGVSGRRLSTKSYGRWPERDGTRKGTVVVLLKVTERSGKKTGVKLGCDG